MPKHPATFGFQLFKTEFGLGMDRLQAALSLEAADSSVHVVRINLDAVPVSAGLFGCDQRRTATGEGVENDSAAFGAIQNSVGDHRRGLYSRVHGKFGTAVLAKGVPSG
jgi:hypothetical protein